MRRCSDSPRAGVREARSRQPRRPPRRPTTRTPENGGGISSDPPGHQNLCNYHAAGIVDVILFNADSADGAQAFVAKNTSTVPRRGVTSKGTQAVRVDLQIDLDAAGLKGKSQEEINAYYKKAVDQILADIKANLTG